MGLRNSKMKLCPRCRLPMDEDDAVVCSMCGQIEGLQALCPARAEALVIAQRRVQAAYYGLDKKGQPNLPT